MVWILGKTGSVDIKGLKDRIKTGTNRETRRMGQVVALAVLAHGLVNLLLIHTL